MKTKIKDILKGKMIDFITKDNKRYWFKVEQSRDIDIMLKIQNEPAIKIITDNKAVLVINVVEGKKNQVKSSYTKFLNKYKKEPVVDMSVDTYKLNGLNNIILE